MSSNLNTVARANLRASKGKYILTGIGIAISSFFIAAVIVLISSLQGTVSASIGDVLTKADNIVISAGANDQSNNSANIYLDEETIKKIQEDPSVASAWIDYQGSGKFGADKTTAYYNQAPTSADAFPFSIDGKLPANDSEIMLSKVFAQKHNLKTGDKVTSQDIVASASDPSTTDTKEYTVSGLFDGGFSGASSNNAVFIGGTAYGEAATKALKNRPAGAPEYMYPGATMAFVKFKGDDQAAARTELQNKLNTGDKNTEPKVTTGKEYLKKIQDQISAGFAFIGTILGAFAALALLVSSFVISNTFAVLIGQRVRELALLRTLGARGSSLVLMLIIEALVVGIVFSAIGALAVYAVAGLLSLLFNNILITYDPMAFVAGVALCTIVTVLASLAPARTALRISPISAMGETTAQAVKKPSIIGMIAGVLVGIGGAVLVSIAIGMTNDKKDSEQAVLLVMLAALLLGVAIFLLTPWILLPLVRGLGTMFRTQTGKLAVANALRSPKRTVSTGRAVLVGALVVATVLTGYSVMNASLAKAMDKTFPISAMAVYGDGSSTGSKGVEKARSVADKARGLKNVEAATVASAAGAVEYTIPVKDTDKSVDHASNLVALSQDELGKVIPGEASQQLADNTVLVPTKIYEASSYNDSTRLKATGPRGTVELKPIKSQTQQTLFIVNTATGAKLQDASDPKPIAVANAPEQQGAQGQPAQGGEHQAPADGAQGAPTAGAEGDASPGATGAGSEGASAPAGEGAQGSAAGASAGSAQQPGQDGARQQELGTVARGNQTMVLVRAASPLSSSDNAALQDELTKANDGVDFVGGLQSRKQIDQILTILLGCTLALLALAIVIAVIGVANTMTLSVNERRRENAMLRSLGLSRKQLRRMISAEAILITLGAVLLGILGGIGIGLLAAKVIFTASNSSAEIAVELPFLGLAFVVLVGLLSALVASALPAVRSARMSPVEGMRS